MLDQSTMRAAVDDLKRSDAHVAAVAIVSHDGLVMVSTSTDRERNETLAAITSEVLSKGKLTVSELGLGELHSDFVFGDRGGVLIRGINEEMVLVAEVRNAVNVGRVFATMNKTASRLAGDY